MDFDAGLADQINELRETTGNDVRVRVEFAIKPL